MKNKILYALLILSLLPLTYSKVNAFSYIYVDLSGNDKNPCTNISPCRTISHGISVANVGDTVYVGSGVFSENVNVSKNITLSGQGSIIDGTGLSVQSGGGLINIPSGIVATVTGFEVRNGSTYGISVFSNGSNISNNIIHDIRGAGLWVRDAKYNTFESNEIYRTVMNNYSGSGCSLTNTGWESAINSWGTSSYNIYIRNFIHDNCGEGVVVHNYDLITNNTFLNNWSVEVYLESVQFASVTNNLIKNTKPYISRGSNQAWKSVPYGVAIGDETTPCATSDNLIKNNIIDGLRHGISFYAYPTCSSITGVKNTSIDNNTIINSKEYGIRILSGNHSDSSITNNIIYTYGSIAKPFTIQSSVFNIYGNHFYSDLNVFEYNSKSYTFSSWSSIFSNNFWDTGVISTVTAIQTTIPSQTHTSTPSRTSTPTSTFVSSTNTLTVTTTPSKTNTPTQIPTVLTATPTPEACIVIFSDSEYEFKACKK